MIFPLFVFISLLINKAYSVEYLKRYGSIEINQCDNDDLALIALDINEFSLKDKIYIKITYDQKIKPKELLVGYKLSDHQGELSSGSLELIRNFVLTFTKPGTSDFYLSLEKNTNSRYLNLAIECYESKIKVKNCKINQAYLEMFFSIFLMLAGFVFLLLFPPYLFMKCKQKKGMEAKNQAVRVNNQINTASIQIKAEEIQNIPTTNNDIKPVSNVAKTEGEVIPSTDNLTTNKKNN